MTDSSEFSDKLYFDFCRNIDNDNISINCKSFKPLYKYALDYAIIIDHVVNVINDVLSRYSSFNVIMDVSGFTLLDIDKHKIFIQQISIVLKNKFPDTLNKCHICEAPAILMCFYKLICMFVDKKTQRKIVIGTPNTELDATDDD